MKLRIINCVAFLTLIRTTVFQLLCSWKFVAGLVFCHWKLNGIYVLVAEAKIFLTSHQLCMEMSTPLNWHSSSCKACVRFHCDLSSWSDILGLHSVSFTHICKWKLVWTIIWPHRRLSSDTWSKFMKFNIVRNSQIILDTFTRWLAAYCCFQVKRERLDGFSLKVCCAFFLFISLFHLTHAP